MDKKENGHESPLLSCHANAKHKIAILGVRSSGKTVLLAGLGGRYATADDNGMFLVPESRETLAYVNRINDSLRKGEWPGATTPDTMKRLEWSLRNRSADSGPTQLGRIAVLDFGGEVYGAAFEGGPADGLESSVKELKDYISEAAALAVLINLSDLINKGSGSDAATSMVWATKKILDFVAELHGQSGSCDMKHRVALVFTQTDRYLATMCSLYHNDLNEMFETLLPMISQSYTGLDVLSAHVVEGTQLDEDGLERPIAGLSTYGMSQLWNWLVERFQEFNARASQENAQIEKVKRQFEDLVLQIRKRISCGDLYVAGSIPKGKLENAHKSMRIQESLDDVHVLFDSTFFGGAREGFVITSQAIYMKELWEAPWRIALDSDWEVNRPGFFGSSRHVFFKVDGHEFEAPASSLGKEGIQQLADVLNQWKKSR